MDENPVKNKYVVLIKSRRMAMYCCNQKYYVSGIAWSRYQEQEKLDHNFGWKDIKILLFLYHQILFFFTGIWSGYCRKVTRSRILHFRLDGGHKKLRGMNLEQNLPFSWLPLKKGHKKATYSWCLQDQQCDLLKVNRTNLKLVDIPVRTPINIADPVWRWI